MYTIPLQVYTAYTTQLEHTTPQYPVSTLHNFTVDETYRKCLTMRERVHIILVNFKSSLSTIIPYSLN